MPDLFLRDSDEPPHLVEFEMRLQFMRTHGNIDFAMKIAGHEESKPIGRMDAAWSTKNANLLHQLEDKIASLHVFDLAHGPIDFFIGEAEELRAKNLKALSAADQIPAPLQNSE